MLEDVVASKISSRARAEVVPAQRENEYRDQWLREPVELAVVVAETSRRVEHELVSMTASQQLHVELASVAGSEALVAETVGVPGQRACAAPSLVAADRHQRP